MLVYFNYRIAFNYESVYNDSLRSSNNKLRNTYLVSFARRRNSLIF